MGSATAWHGAAWWCKQLIRWLHNEPVISSKTGDVTIVQHCCNTSKLC
jgi:hypothetical protein